MSTKRRLSEAQEIINVLTDIAPIVYWKEVFIKFEKESEGREAKASASAYTNTITIYDSFYDNGFWLSAYSKEQPYMKGHINSFKQFKTWILVHEYCHLLYPKLEHTNEFFNNVEMLYIQYLKRIRK